MCREEFVEYWRVEFDLIVSVGYIQVEKVEEAFW